MTGEKIYEKRLTFAGVYGTILEQSARRFQTSETQDCTQQNMRRWRNWQTRTFEVRVVYPWGFKSPPSHHDKNPHDCLKIKHSCGFSFVLFTCSYSQIVTVICGFCTPEVVKIWSLTSAARDSLPVLHDLAGHSMLVRQKGGVEVCVKVRGIGIRGSHSAA